MAELSNLLGAVYGDGTAAGRDPDGPPTPVEPAAADRAAAVPDWADDEHLDAAFAQWKPGPSPEAHAVERALVADEAVPARPLADDLAAALSEALVAGDADHDDEHHDDEHPLEPRRAAAAELAATAGPLPMAPPPPVDTPPVAEHHDEPPTPVAPAAPAVVRTWDRSDDDILPARRRSFFSLSLRRS